MTSLQICDKQTINVTIDATGTSLFALQASNCTIFDNTENETRTKSAYC